MTQLRFSEEQLEKFKQQLLRKREQLMKLQKDFINEALPESYSTNASHVLPTDMGNEITTQDVDLKLATNELKEIKEIDEALERINDETYGYCIECEEPIRFQRLVAIPEAKYCLSCEEDLEHEFKNRYRRTEEIDFEDVEF